MAGNRTKGAGLEVEDAAYVIEQMRKFFFHVHWGKFEPDHEGTELPDETAAMLAAAQFAGELLRDGPRHLLTRTEMRVEVTDGAQPFFVVRRMGEARDPQPRANDL
ncbi:MAG: hypothetical protein AB1942_21495 [Pseudomonadota bacterium]